MNKRQIIAVVVLLGLASCRGNIHGEGSGQFETTSSSKTTVTINGKVVEERNTESHNGGAVEGEFDIVMEEPIDGQPLPDFPARISCADPITDDQFEKVKSGMLKSFGDDDKVLFLKRNLAQQCLKSAQVRDLAMLLTMDKHRLDFAKSFYGHTADKVNYYKVKDAFQFSDTKKNLDQYVNEW